jgi:hypothetical protein
MFASMAPERRPGGIVTIAALRDNLPGQQG